MPIYDHFLLTKEEQLEVRTLLDQYKDYDRLDMCIEMVIENPSEFFMRKRFGKLKIEVKKINVMPEALKFCDGGKCEVDYSKSGS